MKSLNQKIISPKLYTRLTELHFDAEFEINWMSFSQTAVTGKIIPIEYLFTVCSDPLAHINIAGTIFIAERILPNYSSYVQKYEVEKLRTLICAKKPILETTPIPIGTFFNLQLYGLIFSGTINFFDGQKYNYFSQPEDCGRNWFEQNSLLYKGIINAL